MATTGPAITFTGIQSGFDTASIVSALMDIERIGLTRLENKKASLLYRQSAYTDLDTKLQSVRTAAKALSDIEDVLEFKATPGNETLFSATAASSASAANYSVTINQRATKSVLNGTADIGAQINPAAALNSVDSLGSSIKAGTFSINGEVFTVNATDTMTDILNTIQASAKILSATYNAGTDKVEIEAEGTESSLVLGSAADTSNFLEMLNLTSTGARTAASGSALGKLDRAAALSSSRANTAIAAGSNAFTINGISISYDASADSLNTVLQRINDSDANVTATYDSLQDRLVLTNKVEGALGIYAEDVSGNFVAAMGLNAAATVGKSASITIAGINGGNPITSADNIFSEAETGITGLTITAKADSGTSEIKVETDVSKVTDKFEDYIDEYNSLMSFISSKTKSGSEDGKTRGGALFGEQAVHIISRKLRSTLASQVSGITSGPSTLAGIGMGTTGQDPTLTLDADKLKDAILNNAENVKKIVADATNGIMTKIVAYVDSQSNFGAGPLAEKPTQIDSSISRLDASIERFQRNLDIKEKQLKARFAAMESALADIKQGASALLGALPQTQSATG